METLLAFIIIVFVIPSLILPWILKGQIRELKQELDKLKQKGFSPSESPQTSTPQPKTTRKESGPASLSIQQRKTQAIQAFSAQKKSQPINWFFLEPKFMANLPVWLGGLALALAGFFLIKYSIETGLLSASVRLTIGGLFGTGLILSGYWLHRHGNVSNNEKIGQALSGAGVAVLYFCLYAALNFYSLISPLMAFTGMTLVTATTILLSILQGPPIAIMGLIGGFVTPALIESKEPNVQFLMIYLYLVNTALFSVIWKKNWWYLAIPVVCASFVWILFWLVTYFTPADGLWLSLYLLALSGTMIFTSKQAIENRLLGKEHALFLNLITLGGTVFLFTGITINANFSDTQWGLFALLAIASLILAYFKHHIYGFVPWLVLAVTALLFLAWKDAPPNVLYTYLVLYAIIFSFISYGFIWRSDCSLPWSLFSTIAPLIYFLIGYVKFHNILENNSIHLGKDHLWGGLAFALFALFVGGIFHILNRFQGASSEKQKLLTSFTLTAAAFLVMSVALITSQEIFQLTLAAEVFFICWLNRYTSIHILPVLSGILAAGFGLLILPDVLPQMLLFSKTTSILIETPLDLQWSLANLGIPALLIAGASYMLKSKEDGFLVGSFEIFAIALLTTMTNSILVNLFKSGNLIASSAESFLPFYLIMNVFLTYGLICLWVGSSLHRKAIFYSGYGLIAIGLFQLIFEYTLIYNPLWYSVNVGPTPLFNGLLICYGLPILWLYFSKQVLAKTKMLSLQPYLNTIIFILVFTFITLTIRQFYQGSALNIPDFSNAEIYTYSAAWILLGLGFLYFGARRHDKTLLVASLAFISLSIVKVFLYDARELEDLLRVVSFFGLGVSLLALSWFYTRFIFQNQNTKNIRRKK